MSSQILDILALGFDSLKYSYDEALVLCPFHDDHTPSASVNIFTGLFHCFTCGTNSTAPLLAKYFGGEVIFIPDNRENYTREGREIDSDWRSLLLSPLAVGNEYLESRNVSDKTIEKFGIRENDDGIIFPMKNRLGKICGVQVRHYSRSPKYIFYGVRPEIFPFENLMPEINNRAKILFIVEGIFGVLNAERAGVDAVATMGASSFSKAVPMLEFARSVRREKNKLGRVVVAFDPDDAGAIAAAKLSIYGFLVLNPFVVADEINPMDWYEIESEFPGNTTRDPKVISKYSSNSGTFWRNYKRYSKKVMKERKG